MKDEYIIVAEFAKEAGISVQAVYKRFKPKFKQVEGKKMLKKSLLAEFGLNQNLNQVDNNLNQSDNSKMLDFLMKQLEEKDKQIEKLQESLDHSQQLQAIAQKKIELLEQKKEEPDSPAEPSAKSAEEETEYIDVEVREVALREDLQSVLQRMPERPLTDDFEQIHKFKMAKMKFLSELTDRELVLMGYRPSQRPYMKVAALFGKDESNWDILKPSFLD